MATYYGDIPCVKLGKTIHITKSAKECLCGQPWSYAVPYYDKPNMRRTNLIWREIEAVSCKQCKEQYNKNLIEGGG